jgi:hypothetical protein
MSRVLRFPIGMRFAILCCAFCGAGCTKSVSLTQVKSVVLVDGQRLTSGGQVTFFSMDGADSKGGMITGKINDNGEYTMSTEGKQGVPLGRYKVVVTPPMMPSGGDKAAPLPYDKKYANSKDTPLMIEVVASPTEGAYEIKLSSPKK